MSTNTAPTELYFRDYKRAKQLAANLASEASKAIQIRPYPGKNNGFSVVVPNAIAAQFMNTVGAAAATLVNERVNIGVFSATIMMLMDKSSGIASIPEDSLVLEAFRRSDSDLADASAVEVAAYFSSYSDEAQQGIISNVKGIYHELAFVEAENADGDAWVAEVMPSTNHPGVDVVLTNSDTGEIVELQLKATDSAQYVNSALAEGTSGVQVLATEEVAGKVGGVESSGFSNEEITSDVEEFTTALETGAEDTLIDTFTDTILPIGLATTAVGAASKASKGERVDADKLIEDFGNYAMKAVLISLGLSFF